LVTVSLFIYLKCTFTNDMTKCRQCGNDNVDGIANCDECGQSLLVKHASETALTSLAPDWRVPPPPPAPLPPPASPAPSAPLPPDILSTTVKHEVHWDESSTSEYSFVKTTLGKVKQLGRSLVSFFSRNHKPVSDLASPFNRGRTKYEVLIPLAQDFRFVHEPVDVGTASRFIGRESEMESLAQRILFSKGGSFLVTGYRGVGKTSFVNQVVRTLERALPWAERSLGRIEVVDIYLNVARPVQPSEIMHYIIRRLRDVLLERGIYHLLDRQVQDDLTLAYHRTSVNMARKLAEASERSFGFNEASIGSDWMKAAVKVGWTSKKTRQQDYEVSYLGYDDKAAEHDIISISRRLAEFGYVLPPSRFDRLRSIFSNVEPKSVGLKIVFVFDELDKLEEFSAKLDDKSRKPVIDEILGSLKNLFTTSGVTFVFVAGKDLQERWLEDVGKGDSVYESVFSYDRYLPCLWGDVTAICETLVGDPNPLGAYEREIYEEFKKYLVFKGRGIPRRIIRTFNEYVVWRSEHPALAFTREDVRRIRFFAGLQNVVSTNEKLLFGESHEEVLGTQSDKRRLGVYYLLDWVLRQSTSEFTLKKLLSASKLLSAKIALAEEIASSVAENIISVLLGSNYIQEIHKTLDRVQIEGLDAQGAIKAVDEKRFRISPRRLGEMGGLAAEFEADMVLAQAGDQTGGAGERAFTRIGKYRVVRLIGQGGMGSVYEATDEYSGRRVAVKVLMDHVSAELMGRFEREAMIMEQLSHPNIVRLIEWGREIHELYIVMELLDGITLDDMIRRRGKLNLALALAIIRPVIEAAHYIHQKGFVRNDIKPSNIMLTDAGRVCLLDFGITRPTDSDPDLKSKFDTGTGIVIGTPQFMAPEQLRNFAVDERSDIYSLGVMFYKMLTGVFPFEASTIFEVARAQMENAPVAPSAHVPTLPHAIDQVLLKCLEKDPEKRFSTMSDFGIALNHAAGELPLVDLKSEIHVVGVEVKEVAEMDQKQTMPQPTYISPSTMPRAPAPVDSVSTAAPSALPSREVMISMSAPAVRSEPTAAHAWENFKLWDDRPRIIRMNGDRKRISFNVTLVSDPLGPGGYPLGGKISIGRSSENSLVLRDEGISRFQAEIGVVGDLWFVEDLNSNLGTFVNGERIVSRRFLEDGDQLRFGGFVFVFRNGSNESNLIGDDPGSRPD